MTKSFSDRLTPGQIQTVFDALGIDWRPIYDPDNDGWVNCSHDYFNSDLSINIFHGGFVDQCMAGHPDPVVSGIPIRGDIVTLVTFLEFRPNEEHKAIKFIQEVCGMDKGIRPPDMKNGAEFASEWLKRGKENHFVRLPLPIMQSNLSGNEKIVWSAIFSRCGKDEIYSFPGLSRIGEDTGLSRPTVSKSIHHLIEYGLLIEKFRGHNKAPARFPIVLPKSDINRRVEEKHKSAGKESLQKLEKEFNHTDKGGKTDDEGGKNLLRGVVKKFNTAGKEPLPELDSELYTEQLNTEAYKCRTKVHALSLSFFDDSFSPPLGYTEKFIATVIDGLKLYPHYLKARSIS